MYENFYPRVSPPPVVVLPMAMHDYGGRSTLNCTRKAIESRTWAGRSASGSPSPVNMEELGFKTSAELVKYAVKHGIVSV